MEATVEENVESGTESHSAAVLLVVGEPFSDDQRELILERITSELKSFCAADCDLNAELSSVASQAAEGEAGPNGERVLSHCSSSLSLDVLISPLTQTLTHKLRSFLQTPSPYHHLIYAGQVIHPSGGWIIQDDVFTFTQLSTVCRETEVEVSLRSQSEAGVLYVSTLAGSDWSEESASKLTKAVSVQLNPKPQMDDINGLLQFTAYLSHSIKVRSTKQLLASSDVVGNIRFSRPTLYIFPGGHGDSTLFGISGFNLLVNGGFSRKACFWDLARHLDRIDAMLLTHLGYDNLFGVSSVLQRKLQDNVHPEIGYTYFNGIDASKIATETNGGENGNDEYKMKSLTVNLVEEGNRLIEHMEQLNRTPHPCTGLVDAKSFLKPINLYHKIGQGSLDMYVLNPMQDNRELKEFLNQWSKNVRNFSSKSTFPLPNACGMCALLIWRPANPTDNITRILFPGNVPQSKVFEGLDKLKNLDVLQHDTCTEALLTAPKATKKAGAASKAPSKLNRSTAAPPAKPAEKTKPRATKPEPKAEPPKKTAAAAAEKKSATKPATKTAAAAKEPKPIRKPADKTPAKTSPTASTPKQTATPSNTPIEAKSPEKATALVLEEAAREIKEEPSEANEEQLRKEQPTEPTPVGEEAVKEETPLPYTPEVAAVIQPPPEPAKTPVSEPASLPTPELPTQEPIIDLSEEAKAPVDTSPAPVPGAVMDVLTSSAPAATDLLDSTLPEADQAAQPNGDADLEMPEALPDPNQFDNAAFDAIALSTHEALNSSKALVDEEVQQVQMDVSHEPEDQQQQEGEKAEKVSCMVFEDENRAPPSEASELSPLIALSPAANPVEVLNAADDQPDAVKDFNAADDQPVAAMDFAPEPEDTEVVAEKSTEPAPKLNESREESAPEPFAYNSDVSFVEETAADLSNASDDLMKREVLLNEPQSLSASEEEGAPHMTATEVLKPSSEPSEALVEEPLASEPEMPAASETCKSELPEADPSEAEMEAPLAPYSPANASPQAESLVVYSSPSEDDCTPSTCPTETAASPQPSSVAEQEAPEQPSPVAEQEAPGPSLEELGIYDAPDNHAEQQKKQLEQLGIFDNPTTAHNEDMEDDSLMDDAPKTQDGEGSTSLHSNGFSLLDGPAAALDAEPKTNPFLMSSDVAHSSPSEPLTDIAIPEQPFDPHERDSLEREGAAASFDPLKEWGQPMGLPAPDQGAAAKKTAEKKSTTTRKTEVKKADARPPPGAATSTAKKPASAVSRTIKTKAEDVNGKTSTKRPTTAPANKRLSMGPSTAKPAAKRMSTATGAKAADISVSKTAALKPVTPAYVDLTYIPNHGEAGFVDMDFFRRVRARYYVLSAVKHSSSVLNALLEAKQTWEKPDLEVTLIPTYDTDVLRHWMALQRDELALNKISVAPSANRCTIQLQDQDNCCAAYRLEF